MHNGDVVAHPSQPEVVILGRVACIVACPIAATFICISFPTIKPVSSTFKDTGRKLIHSSDPSSSKPG